MKRPLLNIVTLISLMLFVGCQKVPEVLVGTADIPYSHRFVMHKGNAYNFHFPNGVIVAVWCEHASIGGMGEQTTASGLKTGWGESPFKRPEINWKRNPDGSETAGEWKSYIRQGPVITSGHDRATEYILFVDKWQLSIIEDLSAPHDLPITIKIMEVGNR
jgi:hypothetical protein